VEAHKKRPGPRPAGGKKGILSGGIEDHHPVQNPRAFRGTGGKVVPGFLHERDTPARENSRSGDSKGSPPVGKKKKRSKHLSPGEELCYTPKSL